MSLKLCKDCKWFEDRGVGIPSACRREYIEPVLGSKVTENRNCRIVRVDPTNCGPDGKYWESAK